MGVVSLLAILFDLVQSGEIRELSGYSYTFT